MKKTFFVATLLCATFTQAQNENELVNPQKSIELKEVVVSDSKFELTEKQSGKVVIHLGEDVLERAAGMSVAELLNNYAGIQINQSTGQAGSVRGVYVRGSRNRQVVVRINGVTVNDPSAINSEFDFRLLNLAQIENIEVLKGGSSVLFGSGAAAAVVNIQLKQSQNKPIAANFNFTFGTNQNAESQDYNALSDTQISGGIQGTSGKLNYVFNANHQFTNGLSAAEATDPTIEFESNPFEKTGIYAKLGYQILEKLEWSVYANYNEFNNSFDSFGQVDGDNTVFSKQRSLGNIISLEVLDGYQLQYNDGFTWSERSQYSFDEIYKSYNYTFDAFVRKKFNKGVNIAAGANGSYSKTSTTSISTGEESISDDRASFYILDPYVNVVYNAENGFNANVGARLNVHNSYGSHFLYSVNPSYNIDLSESVYIQALASYSTAYITPSLFQLYAASFGNQDLEPEENATAEAGFKIHKNDNLKFSAVYFHRNQENTIGFGSTYINIEEAFETQGVELAFSGSLLKNGALAFNANYTYTDIKDVPSGSNTRIAKDVLNVSLGYELTSATNVLVSYQYRGSRDDFDFNVGNVVLDANNLLDFQINQKVLEHFNVFGRITNILNENYQEIFGFETKGRNVQVGLNFNF